MNGFFKLFHIFYKRDSVSLCIPFLYIPMTELIFRDIDIFTYIYDRGEAISKEREIRDHFYTWSALKG